jgi:hypothetical protein
MLRRGESGSLCVVTKRVSPPHTRSSLRGVRSLKCFIIGILFCFILLSRIDGFEANWGNMQTFARTRRSYSASHLRGRRRHTIRVHLTPIHMVVVLALTTEKLGMVTQMRSFRWMDCPTAHRPTLRLTPRRQRRLRHGCVFRTLRWMLICGL